ncbi:HD domain-containing protein [Mesoplasma lactucae]|uniref:HD family phosphohydrolase n=1 Tax=Mesoplasma lactucae ATCC 49193 TaxID=81460 RepID=A0A291ISJ9_9MOLU|nr:HD domain-containing protein [Mesoplasma lactucae]ATG97740.1 HD family phosphohydrolase [Mesoplasma lactucae ATCC 49193]ATZ20483.1 HD superfamily phosphohydrolase [Mesoplasma lactucae ATCC 49193]MCL8216654.1 hypothetical protein [Mesoplasma lactucae ATCC 49193]
MQNKEIKTIRDAVHGDIKFSDPIFFELINTQEFQRLRRIAQLGGAQFAYPSATHTRFTHSIGVYYVLNQFLENPSIANALSDEDKTLVLMAGLLHDIGHGPFSHSFERITNGHHEEYSQAIITNENGNIAKIIKAHGYNPSDVANIIKGTYKNPIVNLLVSSQLDADRLDYLQRDSYFAGVDYTSLDTPWLINNAKIIDNKIVFNKKAIYAVESYLLGRYHMFRQVYNHKISLAFDAMIQVWFKRLKDLYNNNFNFKSERLKYFFSDILEGKDLPLDKYLQLDDFTMDDLFKQSQLEDDKILNDLATKILNRNFFDVYLMENINLEKEKENLVKKGLDPNYYLLEDKPKKPYVYQNGMVDGKDEKIYFFDSKDNKILSLSDLSELAEAFENINKEKTREIVFISK